MLDVSVLHTQRQTGRAMKSANADAVEQLGHFRFGLFLFARIVRSGFCFHDFCILAECRRDSICYFWPPLFNG